MPDVNWLREVIPLDNFFDIRNLRIAQIVTPIGSLKIIETNNS